MMQFVKKIYRYILPANEKILEGILKRELADSKRILDLGCGPSSPLRLIKNQPGALSIHSVGIDIFSPYIEKNKNPVHSEYIQGNIFDICFPAKSFDCVLLLDVIEHLDKEEFKEFLPKLEKVAKKIIISVPNGFLHQELYDGNKYQAHKSGWTLEDMEGLGFFCRGLDGLKYLRGEFGLPRIKPFMLGEFLSSLSQKFVFKNPRYAFHLFCVKNENE